MVGITCSVCLEELKNPVSIPCGHLHCESCLTDVIEASAEATEANCPTCRTSFTIAHLDPRFVPEKYHKFLNPSVRRIYLDTPDASDTEREHVAQIKMLEQRVMGLQQDKLRLMGRCEAAIASSRKHQEGEHTATFEVQKLRRMYTTLTVKYGELKTKHDQAKGKNKEVRAGTPNYSVSAEKVSKRKSNQPLLDLAAPSSSMGVQDVDRRLILPLPKRPRISSGNTIFHPAEVETSNNPPPRFKKRGNAPLSTESMTADHRYSLMQEPSTRDFQRLPIIGPPPAQTSSSNSTNAGGIGTDVGNGPRIIQLRPGKICAVTWGHGDFSVSFQD